MKIFTKKELIPISIILAVIIAGIIFYPKLPARIPSHWNFNGEIDDYASREFSVIFFPALIAAIYFLMALLPLIDPLRKNIEESGKAYFWLRTVLISFFSAIYMIVLYAGLKGNENFPINLILPAFIGLLFIMIGYLLPNFKRNYFIGIRTPWTLHSDEVWEKTHKRGKKWFIASGCAFILGGLLNLGLWTMIAAIVFLLAPVVDSYFIYRQKKFKI